MAAASKSAPRIALLASALALAACGGEGGGKAPKAVAGTAPAQAREGRLDVLAVSGALPPASLQDFERATRCQVQAQLAADPATLLELAANSDADLLLASGDNASSLVAAGRVRALAAGEAPSLAGIPPRLRNVPGAVVDARRYGVPWRWQPNVLAYDTTHFAQAPTSWSVLFESGSGAAAAPHLLAAPEPIAIADVAIYLSATHPELGIVDPYALDARQYAAALELLQAQRGAWRGKARDVAAQSEAFRNGVTAAPATPASVRALQAQGLPVAWTLPAEGGSAQVEIAMLHVGAAHPNCALAWMQWALQPQAQSRLAAVTGALPVDAAACRLEPLAHGDACARDGLALLPRLQPQRVPEARCGNAACVPYSRWTQDYLSLVDE
jgi:putative spermidine/putrescine transport system substrate-binding protein